MSFWDTVKGVGKVIISPVGAVVGGMPTKEELADRWIGENVPTAAQYTGTLATLTNDITQWSNLCGDHIHQRNPLYNRANGRSICQGKIELRMQSDLIYLKNQEYIEVQNLKKNVGNGNLYPIIALVIIVMIIIVLIMKM